jgi:hypothetical protein
MKIKELLGKFFGAKTESNPVDAAVVVQRFGVLRDRITDLEKEREKLTVQRDSYQIKCEQLNTGLKRAHAFLKWADEYIQNSFGTHQEGNPMVERDFMVQGEGDIPGSDINYAFEDPFDIIKDLMLKRDEEIKRLRESEVNKMLDQEFEVFERKELERLKAKYE